MSNVGILGGSFDPFHLGHLSIANAALEEFDLEGIILLPAKVQPFKVGRDMASERDRVNMIRLITEKNSQLALSTVEAFGDDVSYTYKSLSHLQRVNSEDRLFFILGTDSFLTIEKWYRYKDLVSEFSFLIAGRPGYKEAERDALINRLRTEYDADIRIIHNQTVEVSSTLIKQHIREGKPITDLVPPEIERYINENGLYK